MFLVIMLLSCLSRVRPLKTFLQMSKSNLVVHVRGSVGNDNIKPFYGTTIYNSRNSILEPGISRFDVLSKLDNPGDFLLIEAYKTEQGPAEHKQTAHYNEWRSKVEPWMKVPRSSNKYTTIFPSEVAWDTPKGASQFQQLPLTAIENVNFDKDAFTQTIDYHGKKLYNSLLVVLVDIEVTSDKVTEFIEATINNCRNSLNEPGIYRFDFLQDSSNPCKFILVEAYNTPQAPLDHKKSAHYLTWAKTVESMMARPRQSSKYCSVYPAPLYWHKSSYITHPGEGSQSAGVHVGVSHDYDSGVRGLSAVPGGSFGFLCPKLIFGRNIAATALKTALKDLKLTKPFIVTGKNGFGRYSSVLSVGLETCLNPDAKYAVSGEPTVEDALHATQLAIQYNCDSIISIGGGSSMDLGKAVAALVTNPGDIFDHLEVIGKGLPITNRPIPHIAIPTTSGTGAEATKNAVLKSVTHGRKVSIRHDTMIPTVAIVDPVLTVTCSPETTAHVGLDTLCQVIEPYVCNIANPFTDALAREGILRASRSLRAVVANGADIEAREDLAIASVMGGLCLANSRLGAVHGFAAVLGGMFESAPHGAVCAALLPHVMRKNVEKLEQIVSETNDREARIRLNRFLEVARIVTGNPYATVLDGVVWTEALVADLDVPPVSILCGMKASQIQEVAEAASTSSSTKGNPVVLSVSELAEILTKAF